MPQLTASLTEPATGFSYPCEVTQIHRVAANEWSMFRYQDVAPGGFVVSIDTRGIDRRPATGSSAHGSRRAAWSERDPYRPWHGGGGRLMWARNLRELDDRTASFRSSIQLGFALHVRPERIQADWLTTDGAGKAAGTLRLVDSALGGLVSVAAVSQSGQLPETSRSGRRWLTALRAEPGRRRRSPRWEFRAVDVMAVSIGSPGRSRPSIEVGGGVGDACWQRSTTGYCNLMTDWVVAEAEQVTIGEEELGIELRLTGLDSSDCAGARLSGRLADVPVRRGTRGDGVRLVFPCSPPAGAGRASPSHR